jgi:hypothetical protein
MVKRNIVGDYTMLPARRMRFAQQLEIEGESEDPQSSAIGIPLHTLLQKSTRACVESLGAMMSAMHNGKYHALKSLTLHRATIAPSPDLLTALGCVTALRELHLTTDGRVNRSVFAAVPFRDAVRDMETGSALQHLLQTAKLEVLELWGASIWRPLSWVVRALPHMHHLQRLSYTHYSQSLSQYTSIDERAQLADHLSNLLLAAPECPTLTTLHVKHRITDGVIPSGDWPDQAPEALLTTQLWPPHLYTPPHPVLRELWLPELPLFINTSQPSTPTLPAIRHLRITSEHSRLWGHHEAADGTIRSGSLADDFAMILSQMPHLCTLALPRITLPAQETTSQQFTSALSAVPNLLELSIEVWDQPSTRNLEHMQWIIVVAAVFPQMRNINIIHYCTNQSGYSIWESDYRGFVPIVQRIAQINPECRITISGEIHRFVKRCQDFTPSADLPPLPDNIRFLPLS